MGLSNLLELLQLPKFTHFGAEEGDGGTTVDNLMPRPHTISSTAFLCWRRCTRPTLLRRPQCPLVCRSRMDKDVKHKKVLQRAKDITADQAGVTASGPYEPFSTRRSAAWRRVPLEACWMGGCNMLVTGEEFGSQSEPCGRWCWRHESVQNDSPGYYGTDSTLIVRVSAPIWMAHEWPMSAGARV
jgi:hypothetical protein